jgi:hypothetical protein
MLGSFIAEINLLFDFLARIRDPHQGTIRTRLAPAANHPRPGYRLRKR